MKAFSLLSSVHEFASLLRNDFRGNFNLSQADAHKYLEGCGSDDYSNSDTGALDSVSVRVNGVKVGSFESENTGGGGGWNFFTFSPTIVNTLGKIVFSKNLGSLPTGKHEIVWNGSDDSGIQLPPGVYFYQITITKNNVHFVKKMILSRQ